MAQQYDINAIFAPSATTSAAALQTLRRPENAERNIKLIGSDSWSLLVTALENYEIDSLIVKNPYKTGYHAVKTIAALINHRNTPDPHVLLVHPKVMAHGLTLTEAATMVFYAPIFSNEETKQIIERINSPGQKNKMLIVRMYGCSLEQKIYQNTK